MPCSSACCGATPASATCEVVAELRPAIPGITLSTDIIVGFPGETDDQFEETLSLVTEADFDDAYTFKYSVRDGTPAVRLTDHVADRSRRSGSTGSSRRFAAMCGARTCARIGETHEVLVERPARRGDLMLARTRRNQLVLVDLPATAIGEYHQVRLTGTTGSTFTGAWFSPSPAQGRLSAGGPVIKNLVEDHVIAAYDTLRPLFPAYCGCDSAATTCWRSR